MLYTVIRLISVVVAVATSLEARHGDYFFQRARRRNAEDELKLFFRKIVTKTIKTYRQLMIAWKVYISQHCLCMDLFLMNFTNVCLCHKLFNDKLNKIVKWLVATMRRVHLHSP